MKQEIISYDYEKFLMRVWNNLISYFEDYELDLTQEEKMRFSQGYLFGLKANNYIREKDYIKILNEIANLIVKGDC